MKHKIVAVDSWVKPPPPSVEHDMVIHDRSSAEEILTRLHDATIVVTSGTPINRAAIEAAPLLQMISVSGTGTDHIATDAVREHGITLCHVPAQNTDSVSEHAFALYYAVRRRIVTLDRLVKEGTEWIKNGALHPALGIPPRINAEETLVVIGYGALGKNVEKIGKALGMRVLLAERKGATEIREGRTAFDVAIRQGTLFIVVTPLDDSTRHMISTAELAAMDPTAVLVNTGRGGVVDEAALILALREGRLGGAAVDVFEHEPATPANSALLDPSIPNLVLTPHVAWYSKRTIKGTVDTVAANLEAFVTGKPINMVIAGKTS